MEQFCTTILSCVVSLSHIFKHFCEHDIASRHLLLARQPRDGVRQWPITQAMSTDGPSDDVLAAYKIRWRSWRAFVAVTLSDACAQTAAASTRTAMESLQGAIFCELDYKRGQLVCAACSAQPCLHNVRMLRVATPSQCTHAHIKPNFPPKHKI